MSAVALAFSVGKSWVYDCISRLSEHPEQKVTVINEWPTATSAATVA
jgi:hypothetical protein